ncbi:MAG: murein transglycosylase A [Saprospiraceae bacterium]
MKFILLLSCFFIISCNQPTTQIPVSAENTQDSIHPSNLNQQAGLGYEFENNGKNNDAPILENTFTDTVLNDIKITDSDDLILALKGSSRYLHSKKREHQLSETLTVTDFQIKKTIEAIKKWQKEENGNLADFVKMYQLNGEDHRGNMHFTGYYIPVLKVRKKKDATFKYPLYRKPSKPKGGFPTRTEIDSEGALDNQGLEIAYSDDLLENYVMQVQGSGVVEYEDGSRKLLSFGGKNGYGYKSLGKYLVARGHVPADKISLTTIRTFMAENPDSLETLLNLNPSYIFFRESNEKPSGAASVPLVAKHSVAVDRNQIPLGSILLGEVPVLDEAGVLVGHEFRILAAHDVGGAIKEGHIDFFSGIGQAGEDVANALHHYGRIWYLVAK